MNLAHRLREEYDKQGINFSFDPDKCVHKTWFGREVQVIFDNKTSIGEAYYNTSTRTIHLNLEHSIKKLKKYLLHEAGHANFHSFNFGKTVYTDPSSVIPSLILSYFYLNEISENIDKNLFYATLPFTIPFTLFSFRVIISEFLAGIYSNSKILSAKMKKLIKKK